MLINEFVDSCTLVSLIFFEFWCIKNSYAALRYMVGEHAQISVSYIEKVFNSYRKGLWSWFVFPYLTQEKWRIFLRIIKYDIELEYLSFITDWVSKKKN